MLEAPEFTLAVFSNKQLLCCNSLIYMDLYDLCNSLCECFVSLTCPYLKNHKVHFDILIC